MYIRTPPCKGVYYALYYTIHDIPLYWVRHTDTPLPVESITCISYAQERCVSILCVSYREGCDSNDCPPPCEQRHTHPVRASQGGVCLQTGSERRAPDIVPLGSTAPYPQALSSRVTSLPHKPPPRQIRHFTPGRPIYIYRGVQVQYCTPSLSDPPPHTPTLYIYTYAVCILQEGVSTYSHPPCRLRQLTEVSPRAYLAAPSKGVYNVW